jgi:hypothetical protein
MSPKKTVCDSAIPDEDKTHDFTVSFYVAALPAVLAGATVISARKSFPSLTQSIETIC